MSVIRTARAVAVAGLAVVASGCANETLSPWGAASGLGIGTLQIVGTSAEARELAPTQPDGARKTLSDKVLSAMALERATGRKPDPSRLNDLD